ncbi:unnamed protein product [Rotaria sp. Silwood2]|nr:unnamed protein product [Rotaria sp. Silwood2]CAF3055340.1 unnamed protein product [Rotaria sp. Silwood2]CAF4053049.1 unnamed protein product [Rotaria sp. Silwood2]CAF4335759.1 unnamed protein product [Rotaria sp. Silwood2]
MKRPWDHLWWFCIAIQQFFYHGQAKTIKNTPSDPLSMDEALLTISNKNYSDPILLMYNVIVCEHCDFDQLGDAVLMNSSQTLTIDTRYPYDFRLHSETKNKTISCQIESYKFSEHGSYLFEVIQTKQNEISCTITQTTKSSYYWLPIIIAVIILCIIVFSIQLCHQIYKSRYIGRILTNIGHQQLVNDEIDSIPETSPITNRRVPLIVANENRNDDILGTANMNNPLQSVGSTHTSNNSNKTKKVLPKRLQSLDTFRGFSLMVMIFVNYGGGGYWFFDHSVWNGLTLADLVFPWFVWMMGVSIVLSQRSLLKKKIRKRSILLKICRRTVILFLLGLILQGGYGKPEDVRILGVLQRLALCYFFTAILVLIFDAVEDELHSSQWPIGDNIYQPIRIELSNTVFQFWAQWLCIICITLSWILITFVPKLSNCPRGYVGPGGKHEHGRYTNCTGGVAGYLDRVILRSSHLFNYPTCKEIYKTQIPYDPEGLLGILTGTLLCYLGVQAGHSFVFSTRVRRVCAQWIASSLICGFLGLLLSEGGHSDSWIPINKNLWSLSFIFILASLAFIILTILYLLVDVYKCFTGEPWLWLGMNSIVLYVGHDVCSQSFPVQFEVKKTHAKLLAVHVYGALFWALIAGIMYYKKIFIAI